MYLYMAILLSLLYTHEDNYYKRYTSHYYIAQYNIYIVYYSHGLNSISAEMTIVILSLSRVSSKAYAICRSRFSNFLFPAIFAIYLLYYYYIGLRFEHGQTIRRRCRYTYVPRYILLSCLNIIKFVETNKDS